MPAELAQKFRTRLKDAEQKLATIDESNSDARYYSESWTRKEVLGHLLDSAANNHVRFVVASIEGKFAGPCYAQSAWVKAHGYGSIPWAMLLERWRAANTVLAEVVERIPEERLGAECVIGEDKPATLRFIIEDYLDHMDHHVADIVKQTGVGSTEG